jgi:hypothetical protein
MWHDDHETHTGEQRAWQHAHQMRGANAWMNHDDAPTASDSQKLRGMRNY